MDIMHRTSRGTPQQCLRIGMPSSISYILASGLHSRVAVTHGRLRKSLVASTHEWQRLTGDLKRVH